MATSILPGSERGHLPNSMSLADADPGERLEISIILRHRNRDAFRSRLANIASGAGVTGHLNREQFAAQHGADPADISAVTAFVTSHGLVVVEASAARRTIVVSGTVSQCNDAFGVRLRHVSHPGGTYRGRTGSIQVPSELAEVIVAVLGMDNRPQAKPHFRMRPSSGNVNWRAAGAALSSFTPTQLASLYKFPPGDGQGQCVAIIELGGGFRPEDLSQYFGKLGTGTPTVTSISVDQGKNAPTGDPNGPDGEVMLDIEVVGAVVPQANIAVYFAPNTDAGFLDAITTAVHDTVHRPSVISISWGGAESNWTAQAMNAMDEAFQAAAAMGISVCVASGDNGSSDDVSDGSDHVDFPASSPFALACGGTRLTATATDISAEVVWNDGASGGATGGGVSTHFPLPAWQAAAVVTKGEAAPAALTMRGVPDVCGNADPNTGYSVRVDGVDSVIGGTSAVAPLWAALIARINQANSRALGFINPQIYGTPSGLNDITAGNNGDFSASTGWDACTGLGSPSGANLPGALTKALSRAPAAAAPLTGGGSTNPPLPQSAATSTASAPAGFLAAAFDPATAAFYGTFVKAAYSMYESDPHNVTPSPSPDFPAGYNLLAWIQMRDFLIGSTGPLFYGFVAQCAADPSRFVIAIRGTEGGVEWWDDANAIFKIPFKVAGCGSVGAGFARIYDTLEVITRSPASTAATPRSLVSTGTFSAQIAALVRSARPISAARESVVPAGGSVEVTGHSLGGALATLYVLENAHTQQIAAPALCTFASPFVGDSAFASALNGLSLTSWRIVNIRDVVPKLPGSLPGFTHVQTEYPLDSSGKVKSNPGCWHAMSTYLNLLNASLPVGPDCRLDAQAASLARTVTIAPDTPPASAHPIPVTATPMTLNLTINVG